MSRRLLSFRARVKPQTTGPPLYPDFVTKFIESPQRFAANLRALMRRDELSEQDTARRSGVSQKGINLILRGISNPTLRTCEALAGVFNLPVWLMLAFDFAADPDQARWLQKLVDDYTRAPAAGRQMVNMVAEREAAYTRRNPSS